MHAQVVTKPSLATSGQPTNIKHSILISLSTFENYCHCQKKQRTRALGTRELIRPRSSKTKAGSRAFYVVAPYLWNFLPAEVRTAETYSIFRKKIKTHFFASCFLS